MNGKIFILNKEVVLPSEYDIDFLKFCKFPLAYSISIKDCIFSIPLSKFAISHPSLNKNSIGQISTHSLV